MNNSLTGFLGLGLLCLSAVATGSAQQQTPPTGLPPAAPTVPPATIQLPTTPAPTAPVPTAPAPQTEAPATPTPQPRNIPAPPPKVADVRMPGEAGYYIGLSDWMPIGKPWIDKGHGATFTGLTKLQFAGTPKYTPSAEIGIAAGAHNTLKISVFQSKASGTRTAPTDVVEFAQPYSQGNVLSTSYKIQDAKISFEYLTWPFPVGSRHFRLKTLWQVQYVAMKAGFDAPLLPTIDSSGNPVTFQTTGSTSFFTPTLGLGIVEYATRNFRFEANASGFDIPHHTAIWDADASIAYRAGHIEIRGGAKALHFKTSTKSEYFQYGSLGGAFVGLRWYSD